MVVRPQLSIDKNINIKNRYDDESIKMRKKKRNASVNNLIVIF